MFVVAFTASSISKFVFMLTTSNLNGLLIFLSQHFLIVFHSAQTNEDQLVHNIHFASEEISQENCRQYYDKMESNDFKILAGKFLDD